MSYANKEMNERDADLGYIKIYLQEIHEFLDNGGILSDRTSLLVKEAYDKMQESFCSFTVNDITPDKKKKR